jgi:mRNA interferase MazF
MPRNCAINCDHLQTISKGKLGSLVTLLPPTKMEEVGYAVCFALGL